MDTNPRMAAAGISHASLSDAESAAYCVQPDCDPRASSYTTSSAIPQEQSRWRTSYRRTPGQRFIHAGLVDIPLPPAEYRHGIRTGGGSDRASTDTTLFQHHDQQDHTLQQFLVDQKESIYRSNIREPLGSAFIRGHSLPEKVYSPEFKFGVSTSESESAKNLIYYPTQPPHIRSHGGKSMEEVNEQVGKEYAKQLGSVTTARASSEYVEKRASVGGYGGESYRAPASSQDHAQERLVTRPIDREYNWTSAGINPHVHRFGKTSASHNAGSMVNSIGADRTSGTNNILGSGASSTETGVSGVLKHAHLTEARTVIGSKRQEEVKSNSYDSLGHARPVRGVLAGDSQDLYSSNHGDRLNPSGHRSYTFGKPGAHDEWGARDCIRGVYSEQEQLPDPDLGKSRWQLTNISHIPTDHLNRSFGLPTIRADRPPPRIKSVASDMNYGDESNGKGLLYPAPHAFEGINEEDFLKERKPEEVRAILAKALNITFDDENQFRRVCDLAAQRYGLLSVDSFRHTWNQVRLEIICQECNAVLCQHEDCRGMKCRHTPNANHARHARHVKQEQTKQIDAAGFSNSLLTAQ